MLILGLILHLQSITAICTLVAKFNFDARVAQAGLILIYVAGINYTSRSSASNIL